MSLSRLSLFACPRAFDGPYRTIQLNAIHSWTLLNPKPEIILFGNDAGTAEVARQFGLRHVPDIACNENGTPLVSGLFRLAEQLAKNDILCYVNSDIILMRDFMQAVNQVASSREPFLMIGERQDLDVNELLPFENNWEENLRARAFRDGKPYGYGGTDYFVYRKGFWGEIPKFALGRFLWDNWLLYQARKLGALLIDATSSVTVVHQNHFFPSPQGAAEIRKKEGLQNLALLKQWHFHTILEATHRLTPHGLQRSWSGTLRLSWLMYILKNTYWYPLLTKTKTWRHFLGIRTRSSA